MQNHRFGPSRDQQWDADEVWWEFWEVWSIKLLIPWVYESSRLVCVIAFSLVGGDMLPGKSYQHGLVWNQILLSQPLTSLLYDRMWKLAWISAWGQCLPLSREYDVSLHSKTCLSVCVRGLFSAPSWRITAPLSVTGLTPLTFSPIPAFLHPSSRFPLKPTLRHLQSIWRGRVKGSFLSSSAATCRSAHLNSIWSNCSYIWVAGKRHVSDKTLRHRGLLHMGIFL